MGDCQSTPSDQGGQISSREEHARTEKVVFKGVDTNGSGGRRWGGGNRRSNITSLIRVGSIAPKRGVKASTYNHVHLHVTENVDHQNAGVVGFTNLGNTCFMNSSIQCLSATIPLTDYFLGYDFRKEINETNVLGTKGAIVTSYADLMKKVWLGKDKVVTPAVFKSKVEKIAPQFAGGAQHDAQEFLSYMLDGIHEDLNRVHNRPYIEDIEGDGTNDAGQAMQAWQNYLLRNKSVVVDLFQGQLRNTLTCRNARIKNSDGTYGCGHKCVKFEPFMYLSLPISDETATLNECFELYCAEEVLSGANSWYCSKCKDHVEATKKFDLWMLPPILIVHLKRFKYDDWGVPSKIDQTVYFPVQNWDLSSAMKSADHERPVYDLYAVSNHYGDLGSGHYTAHAMNRVDDKWYDLNDKKTTRISEETLGQNSAAYCLFYNRTVPVEKGDARIKSPIVRRQSVDRPELWPHLQTQHGMKSYRKPVEERTINNEGKNEVQDPMPTIAKIN